MSTLNIFSTPVKYYFKIRWFSLTSLIVIFILSFSIVIPLILSFQAGGFWLKNRVYIETPTVKFTYKYILIANKNFKSEPIVCSSFPVFLNTDCRLIKIEESDINKDRKTDIFKFEVQFYTSDPVKHFQLLLFFQVELKEVITETVEVLASYDYSLPSDVQDFHLIADLKLNQKGFVRSDSFEAVKNETFTMENFSLGEILEFYARKKFTAELGNPLASWQPGFADDEPVKISAELFNLDQVLYYQPNVWEELKWAWIQYFSVSMIFTYSSRKILKILFTKGYLKSCTMVPALSNNSWKQKDF